MSDSIGRLVISSTVYHQISGEDPTSVEGICELPLVSSEQPYTRRISVSTEWTPIDVGWLDEASVGLLCLSNEMGKRPKTIPSPEEIIELAKQQILIGVPGSQDMILAVQRIHPKQSTPLCPINVSQLFIRAADKPVRATITVFPK